MLTRGPKCVDDCGNVSYEVRDGDTVAGVIEKTCSAWQLTLPSGDFVPVRSVKAGMEWFGWHEELMARAPLAAWLASFNTTRGMWQVWRPGSPPIAYCYGQEDAEKIARLLSAAAEA